MNSTRAKLFVSDDFGSIEESINKQMKDDEVIKSIDTSIKKNGDILVAVVYEKVPSIKVPTHNGHEVYISAQPRVVGHDFNCTCMNCRPPRDFSGNEM